ncbi:MAG TPA: sialidase family protein [Ktedonobacterales bacterium]|nr:sialidase family protein [Ktedonobacterales bacterium]
MNRDVNDAKRSAAQDSVPAALLDIHQQLLKDGAAWRDDLPLGATQALQETAPAPQRSVNERSGTNGWSGRMTALAQPPNMPRRDVSWGRRLIASAAILVVVGLLGALFATFARGRNDPRVAGTPTAGPLATWSIAPHLTNQPVPPMLAPSDPSVVYEAGITGADFAYVFRRSDDAGATWRNLTVPDGVLGAYTLGDIAIWVDPANAQNVIVTLSRLLPQQGQQDCPTTHASVAFARKGDATSNTPASGTGGCQLQFFSADGGEHWSEMRFPVSGSISSGWSLTQRTLNQLQSQGTRLYTAIHYRGQESLTRIFTSQDRGATWDLADTGLYATDRSICDFVTTPDSTTLYATTGATECFQSTTPQDITLWRSDDAGTHWNQLGSLPGGSSKLIAAFKRAGHADVTLYVAATDQEPAPGFGVERAWVSEDGGRQWNAVPDLGDHVVTNAFLNERRDGSLLQITQTFDRGTPATSTPSGAATATPSPVSNGGVKAVRTPLNFMSWSSGQAGWRQIAQPVTDSLSLIYAVESVSKDGTRTLWAVTQLSVGISDSTYGVRMARLS